MSESQLLLFDLGGVLVEFSGIDEIVPLLASELTETEIRERFSASSLLRDFECGRMTAADFAQAFVAEWRLKLPATDFVGVFESWTKQVYPGAIETLTALRPRYRLAALSNSNELHWRRNNEVLGVAALFERAFSSHETGLRKPDPEAFIFALKTLAVAPEDVTFFDDVEANIDAARALGIAAYQVQGVEELKERLRSLGML